MFMLTTTTPFPQKTESQNINNNLSKTFQLHATHYNNAFIGLECGFDFYYIQL